MYFCSGDLSFEVFAKFNRSVVFVANIKQLHKFDMAFMGNVTYKSLHFLIIVQSFYKLVLRRKLFCSGNYPL